MEILQITKLMYLMFHITGLQFFVTCSQMFQITCEIAYLLQN